MYSGEILRQLPCYHCVHCVEKKGMKRGRFAKRKCALTNRWGNMNKAFCCMKFENKRAQSSTEEVNGCRIRKNQVEDYRTANQWESAGYRVKPGAKGAEMYASQMAAMQNAQTFIYYLPEQVENKRSVEV